MPWPCCPQALPGRPRLRFPPHHPPPPHLPLQIGSDMALILYRLGKFSYSHRWLVISLWLAALVAVGGSAAAFYGAMSNNFQIPGTETQRMLDKLKTDLPESAGGSAGIVFEAGNGQFDQAAKDAVSAALAKLQTLPDVQGTV